MTKVLITGASGFVGAALQKVLRAAGMDVFGTSSRGGGEHIACNLSDTAQVEAVVRTVNPDIVVHSAAISSVTHSVPLDYYATNVIGTKNLLAALRYTTRRAKFVLMSTAGVYGNQPVEVLDETLVPKPTHDYGMSKLCAELWTMHAGSFYEPIIIRPFNIVGPGQNSAFIVPKLARAFASGERTIKLGNMDVYRDYIDIDAFCDTVATLLSQPHVVGETVNLCSGRGTSLRELIDAFQLAAGYEIEVIKAPEFVRPNEVWRLIGSREKLKRLVASAPQPASIETMAHCMHDFYKGAIK